MKENIAIFGAGTMASSYIDVIQSQGKYNLVGLFDAKYPDLKTYCDYQVIGSEDNFLEQCKKRNIKNISVCIGDNYIRYKVVEKLKNLNPDIKFPVLIHKSASVSKNTKIGEGSIIMALVCIDASTVVGKQIFVGMNSAVPHGCHIGDYSSLSSGVSLAGEVHVGEFTFLGVGSTVSHCKEIGNNVIIGAGSVVVKDIPDNVVAYGVPARVMRSRELGEKYL